MGKINVTIQTQELTGAVVFNLSTKDSGLTNEDRNIIIESVKKLVGFDAGLERMMIKIRHLAESKAAIPGHDLAWDEVLERVSINREDHLVNISHATQGGFSLSDILRLAYCAVELYKNPNNEVVYQELGVLTSLFDKSLQKKQDA